MRINHNIAALNTYSRLTQATAAQSKSLEKLSSGQRINKAGDDAAGLAISEKMRNQIKGLDQASRNAQDGISLIQTAEGALNETHSMLLRMRELVVQANNDTNDTDDLNKIQDEINQLAEEITGIADKTEFNGKKLIDGSLGVSVVSGTASMSDISTAGISVKVTGLADSTTITFTTDSNTISARIGGTTQTISVAANTAVAKGVYDFNDIGVKLTFASTANATVLSGTLVTDGEETILQIGANADQDLGITINNMKANAIGLGSGSNVVDVDVTSLDATQNFEKRLQIIDSAIETVSAERSKMGAWQNRLEHTIANLSTSSENLTAAESRVRDVDMAKEMMEFTKNNILNQAATAMLAQANQQPQSVLQLLQ